MGVPHIVARSSLMWRFIVLTCCTMCEWTRPRVNSQDDEMGSAVNLQTRQVRKIMNELHQDHLVCEYESLVFGVACIILEYTAE